MPIDLTWLGHATWLVTTPAGRLIVDPFLDENPSASMRAADVECDAILLTHGHFDHVADCVAIAKRTKALASDGAPPAAERGGLRVDFQPVRRCASNPAVRRNIQRLRMSITGRSEVDPGFRAP
jgi:L-ascorbate metabolism protein UlaG (beta-lactamase superfamily)